MVLGFAELTGAIVISWFPSAVSTSDILHSIKLRRPLLISSSFTLASAVEERGLLNPFMCANRCLDLVQRHLLFRHLLLQPASFQNIQCRRFNRRFTVCQRRELLGRFEFTTCEMCRRTRDRSGSWNRHKNFIFFRSSKREFRKLTSPKLGILGKTRTRGPFRTKLRPTSSSYPLK
jgi:hypothetical protein